MCSYSMYIRTYTNRHTYSPVHPDVQLVKEVQYSKALPWNLYIFIMTKMYVYCISTYD